jgi:hypothetical protein
MSQTDLQEITELVNVETLRTATLKVADLDRITAECVKTIAAYKAKIQKDPEFYQMIDLLGDFAIILEEVANNKE